MSKVKYKFKIKYHGIYDMRMQYFKLLLEFLNLSTLLYAHQNVC